MSIDRQEASARSEFETALEIIASNNEASHYELLRRHTEAWKAVWAQGLIEVEGNLQVGRRQLARGEACCIVASVTLASVTQTP